MTAVSPMNGKTNGFHDGEEDIEAPGGMKRVVSSGALGKMGMRITFQVQNRSPLPPPLLRKQTHAVTSSLAATVLYAFNIVDFHDATAAVGCGPS